MLDESIIKADSIKTSIFGYNKAAVMERFIQFQQEYGKLEKQLNTQVEEIESLNKSIQSLEKEKHDLEAQMVEQDILVEDLKHQVATLTQQAEDMRKEVLAYNKANPTNQIKTDLSVKENNTDNSIENKQVETTSNVNYDEDVFVGEIEDRRTKPDETHMIGNQDEDEDDFEFL